MNRREFLKALAGIPLAAVAGKLALQKPDECDDVGGYLVPPEFAKSIEVMFGEGYTRKTFHLDLDASINGKWITW